MLSGNRASYRLCLNTKETALNTTRTSRTNEVRRLTRIRNPGNNLFNSHNSVLYEKHLSHKETEKPHTAIYKRKPEIRLPLRRNTLCTRYTKPYRECTTKTKPKILHDTTHFHVHKLTVESLYTIHS